MHAWMRGRPAAAHLDANGSQLGPRHVEPLKHGLDLVVPVVPVVAQLIEQDDLHPGRSISPGAQLDEAAAGRKGAGVRAVPGTILWLSRVKASLLPAYRSQSMWR